VSSLGCLVESFIETFNHKLHLHDLVKNNPIQVCIDTEKGKSYFIVQNGIARNAVEESVSNECDIVSISTSYDTATELLSGRIKLREAQAQKLLTVSGSLRTALLLETVFYLTTKDMYITIDSEKLNNIY